MSETLINDNVPCYCFCNIHVDFKMAQLYMNLGNSPPATSILLFLMSISFILHADFKKYSPLKLKGQGTHD